MILFILTSVLLFSCSPDEPDAPVSELPFFFVGTINGQTIGFAAGSTQGASYSNQVYEKTEQPAPDSFHVYEGTTVFEETTAPNGSATISLMGIFNHDPGVDERAALFTPGYKRYALSDSTMQGGAHVRFVDGNGVSWSSENHVQSDTSFRIEIITPVDDTAAKAIFQARFSCKLFSDTGDSIYLENGSVRGKILKP
ncbi:MAG: hypothetical protein EOO05_08660 [Chitinophagaceae bacterium]|nr:MAG: hypothetical protein EOO05_08660 [Chitinophagaceae bacterium]